ncbi:CHAT domain-containing protein [Kibdelosporangium aridum]|nr:CHAT domain-containing protein [Kibdelosporangium aridum]
MVFDELHALVRRRITNYMASAAADIILSESALVEANHLWRVAQPQNPSRPTRAERQRLADACTSIGWLYCLRYFALPEGSDSIELARAVTFLQPFTHNPELIPEPLRRALGPTADPDVQGADGTRLLAAARQTADLSVLHPAIHLLTAAISSIDAEHPRRPAYLSNLSSALQDRYQRLGQHADLDTAIRLATEAAGACSRDDQTYSIALSTLANGCWLRHERDGREADLDQSIELGTQAVAASSDDAPDRAQSIINLSCVYRTRHDRTKNKADLHKAVELSTRAVSAIEEGHPNRPLALFNLGSACMEMARSHGADVDPAIGHLEQALAVMPDGHDQLAELLSLLGRAHAYRYVRRGALSDLDTAIQVAQRAVAVAGDGHPQRHTYLADLALHEHARFEHSGALVDLTDAIHNFGNAIALMRPDDPDRPVHMAEQGMAYQRKFDHSGQAADLERAIDLGEQAIATASESHSEWPRMLARLSSAYRKRFRFAGTAEDLDQAFNLAKRAADAVDDTSLDKVTCLLTLSNAHMARFDRNGSPADLDQVIDLGEHVLLETEQHDVDWAVVAANLCGAYWKRFDRGGVAADLDRGIALGEAAVAQTPDSAANKGSYLAHLGAIHQARYSRFREVTDLDRAIHHTKSAVEITPQSHYTRPGYMSDLAGLHHRRYRRSQRQADLDMAIDLVQQALALSSPNDPERARYLSSLSILHTTRFDLLHVDADLDRATALARQALSAAPHDHPHRAIYADALAGAYLASTQTVSQHQLHTLARDVSEATTSFPVHRIKAATSVGLLAEAMGEYATATQMLDTAVTLLPSAVPRETSWADQEHRLGAQAGLVGEAVAAHCATNDVRGAVEIAELGRGILLAAQLDSRTDLTDLEEADPKLASAFHHVRAQLNASDDTPTGSTVTFRRRLWAEYDDLLAQIRRRPGFARFLLPARFTDLRAAATGGAVLLVNAGENRGDAIIIHADADPELVPLPELTMAAVRSRGAYLMAATATGDSELVTVLPEILSWLWDIAVRPIVDALAHTGDSPLRVWWMPLGLLNLFPLHAAGHPDEPGALDRLVSSYTSTLRTLTYARARPSATERRQLVVALDRTPGLANLVGTATEAAALQAQHPDIPALTNETATATGVLTALPRSTWVHLACHASTNATAPSQGGVHLHDRVLRLSEVSRLHLKHAELAYLSACSTADGGIRHADESLHLASAFQLAGFRHVIASLWPLKDRIAAVAARAFYERLPDKPTADHSAAAMREVTLMLRDRYRTRADLWAPLIHTGP